MARTCTALAEVMPHEFPSVGFTGAGGHSYLIKDGATGWLAQGLDGSRILVRIFDDAMRDQIELVRYEACAVHAMAVYMPEAQIAK